MLTTIAWTLIGMMFCVIALFILAVIAAAVGSMRRGSGAPDIYTPMRSIIEIYGGQYDGYRISIDGPPFAHGVWTMGGGETLSLDRLRDDQQRPLETADGVPLYVACHTTEASKKVG